MQKDHCCCRGMPFPFHYGTGTHMFMRWKRAAPAPSVLPGTYVRMKFLTFHPQQDYKILKN